MDLGNLSPRPDVLIESFRSLHESVGESMNLEDAERAIGEVLGQLDRGVHVPQPFAFAIRQAVREYVTKLVVPAVFLSLLAGGWAGSLVQAYFWGHSVEQVAEIGRELSQKKGEALAMARVARDELETNTSKVREGLRAVEAAEARAQEAALAAGNLLLALRITPEEGEGLVENELFIQRVADVYGATLGNDIDELAGRVEQLESGQFGTLSCKRLEVRDGDGRAQFLVIPTDSGGVMATLRCPSGETGVRLLSTSGGGHIDLRDSDGHEMVRASVEGQVGFLRWKLGPGRSWERAAAD